MSKLPIINTVDIEKHVSKNAKIADSYKKTRERRLTQVCQVRELKINQKLLTQEQKDAVRLMFLQAKWLRNDILHHDDVHTYKPGKTVDVRLVDGTFETRELSLGSQVKQSIHDQLKSDIKSLSTRKSNGGKVGRIGFCKEMKSINLKQHGTTFSLHKDCNKVSVQKIPGRLPVHGMSQIDEHREVANAKLVSKPSGFYLMVTTFIDVHYWNTLDVFTPGTVVGIDMGIKDHITLSNGEKISVCVPESKRITKLSRSMERSRRDAKKRATTHGDNTSKWRKYASENYVKMSEEYNREWEKISQKREQLAKAITREIMKNEVVFYQDENLVAWKTRFGPFMQGSILGRVKSLLDKHPRAYKIGKFIPTTQLCPECRGLTKHTLEKRTFLCQFCGYTSDRDVNAAKNMIIFGCEEYENTLPMDCGEVKNACAVEGVFSYQQGSVLSGLRHYTRCCNMRVEPCGEASVSLKQETSVAKQKPTYL